MTTHLSYRAGKDGKMKRQNVTGLANHTYRKTAKKYKNHKNEDIDVSRTHLNIDRTKDGKPLKEIVENEIERRYKGKRSLRSDSVVSREIVSQPSGEHFDGMTDQEKQAEMIRFTNDLKKWLAEEFGEENILGYSIHLDETNPHVHISVMPMTEDGRLSQKDFFNGPNDLKRHHRELRKHMNSLGWDFEQENKHENINAVDNIHEFKKGAKAILAQREEYTDKKKEIDEQLKPKAVAQFNKVIKKSKADYMQKLKEDPKTRETAVNELLKDPEVMSEAKDLINSTVISLDLRDEKLKKQEKLVDDLEKHAQELVKIAKQQIDNAHTIVGKFKSDLDNIKMLPDVYKQRILQVVERYEEPEKYRKMQEQKEIERQVEMEREKNRGRSR